MPLRRQTYTKEALVHQAQLLAERHRVRVLYDRGKDLFRRFRDNQRVIEAAYFELSEAAQEKESLTPGVEWLLDNYHVIQQNGREVKKDLPPTYYRKLPKLKRGDFRGYPRVLHLALEFVAHTDSKVDEDLLDSYLQAYQGRKPLTIGELWAVPTMLRLVLIENLRRIVEVWIDGRIERLTGDILVERLFGDSKRTGTELLLQLAKELKEVPAFSSAGYVHLIQSLRSKGPRAALAVGFLEEKVREHDRAIEEVIRAENHISAANQVSMVNIFTSFRTIGSLDWKKWVEKMSRVHHVLQADPLKIYAKGDFTTRDHYRQAVELLAQRVRRTESAIAEEVVQAAREGESSGDRQSLSPRAHVGYYLIGEGREDFEKRIGYRPPLLQLVGRAIKRNGFAWYGGSITTLLVLLLITGAWIVHRSGGELLEVSLFVALFLLPATEISSNIVQWLITMLAKPTPLAKLDLSEAVPDEMRSLVAVHGIFSERESIRKAVEALEVRFLANQDQNIFFGLMADLHDADSEVLPTDAGLIEYATTLISTLNQRHGKGARQPFSLLFRKRIWNPAESKFMGWERKRGKITELNRLIRGQGATSFKICVGSPELFRSFKYVITLDLDTQLPRGTAHKLIGTIAHPLNRAVVNPQSRMVVKGYGIIQPRVGVSLISSQGSNFSKIFTGHSGIDPYTQCVSDVYQDLFGEGSFIGKAILDVEAFEQSLENRVPDNSLLSHDLFEGLFARCGLATDVELLDDFPSRYHVYTRRQHRWVRGDWQLLPWISPFIKGETGRLERNPLSNLGRWKLIDNLRRSLVAPATFLFLLAAWTVLPGSPVAWSILIALFIAFPVFTNLANSLAIPRVGFSAESYFKGIFEDAGRHTAQAVLAIAFIPHQALVALDAVVVTLYRLCISRKNFLEWETAYHAERRLQGGVLSFLAEMLVVPFASCAALLLVTMVRPEALSVASIVCGLWILSPFIAAWISRIQPEAREELTAAQKERLKEIGWETWCFFDHLLSPENHYLIPDNIQLVPQEVVARRTSPTNISLSMLSVVAAVDLGFTTAPAALRRLQAIMSSLRKLERFNGHFLNWYGTDHLQTLAPRYVSTVDSGNLVGHFIALRVALLQLARQEPLRPEHHEHLTRLIRFAYTPPPRQPERIRPLTDGLKALEHQIERSHSWNEKLSVLRRFKEHHPELWGHHDTYAVGLCRFVDELLESESHIVFGDKSQLSGAFQQVTSELYDELTKYIEEIDFLFLFDPARKLFAIGYNADIGKRDAGYYDLLASEARLGSLVAIAKGQVDEEHWFMLGRSLTDTPGGRALLSWSGTMFEYLMPILVTKDYPTTLLSRTYRAVVKAQQAYGKLRGVPWGFSESGYSGVDFERTYQYRAFGVPGLGLKRGLSEDIVVSPYSTFLALSVAPNDAIKNIDALENAGMRGRYGFYESCDYTAKRLGRGEKSHVVQSFFAHHQGMSFISIANVITEGIFQDRFHADPLIKATEILLQERFPRYVTSLIPHQAEQSMVNLDQQLEAKRGWDIERVTTPFTDFPRTHLLSNGHYTVMMDNSGSGFSTFDRSIALTRWREDEVVNDYGSYIFVRDLASGKVWSSTYQPTRAEPERYEVIFTPDKIECIRRDEEIGLHTEIVVSPEDNVEIRRITLTNFSGRARQIELTSYGEVVLGSARGEAVHPAFSNMFIESEFIADYDALLFARRPRSVRDERLYLFHMLSMNVVWEKTQFDTSRFSFVGRGRSVHNPIAFESREPLKGATGSVIDPIFSLRAIVEIEPQATQVITFVTGFAKARTDAEQLISRYHSNLHSVSRAFEMAWSQSSVELRVGQFSAEDAVTFQRLANLLLFNVEGSRIAPSMIARNRLHQSGFWRFGVSGDMPIVFARIAEPEQASLIQELLLAHEYLRNRGMSFDLIIFNEYPGGYSQDFQRELEFTIRAGRAEELIEKPGGIFLRTSSQLSAEEVLLVESVARVVLQGARGGLSEQLVRPKPLASPELVVRKPSKLPSVNPAFITSQISKLDYFNGSGGFVPGGRGYSLAVQDGVKPPLPWSNVVANPEFGFLITESGGGYTWSENSRENRLTPWSNDAVTDRLGEVIYIRNAANGSYWSATPAPCSHGGAYLVTHSFGETSFESESGGLHSVLTVSGAPNERAKIYRLKLRNLSDETVGTYEVYLYVEWVLGVLREDSYRQHVVSFDPTLQTLYAVNNYNNEFAGRLAYIGSDREISGYTGSRFEFIGRHRDLSCPLVLDRASNPKGISPFIGRTQVKLDRKVGAGLNSCGVVQVQVRIEPGEEQELHFFLGEAQNQDAMRQSVARLRLPKTAQELRLQQDEYWKMHAGSITVETPEKSFNLLMNGWLQYQTISCRLHGRSGFYQSGGAIGFRDQLQDSLALLHINPALTRAQILLHATRQFTLGDVQHWWHPPTGRGVRTTISDDLLWLPYVVDEYLKTTGDFSILDETANYLEGPRLESGHADMYFVPNVSLKQGSIYEHCWAAIERALAFGPRGLPIIGGGDWNDGMNEVGKDGRGESVWLGWFLCDVLRRFRGLAEIRGDTERAKRYQDYYEAIRKAVEEQGWDGGWYRRAYFDDGTPLGSASNSECRIDSLAQSWAVISRAGDPERAKQAMQEVYAQLVDDEARIILLLTPAFDRGDLNPGYIKGYLPGLRENGAQYTHAATWVVLAASLLGDGSKAFELFQMLNPITHGRTKEEVDVYQGEPYVLCGDVYSNPQHRGRAGWSWYTGSSGWLYRIGLENILGIKVGPEGLTVSPCIPPGWKSYRVRYRHARGGFDIEVRNPLGKEQGVSRVVVDGTEFARDGVIPFPPSGVTTDRHVLVELG